MVKFTAGANGRAARVATAGRPDDPLASAQAPLDGKEQKHILGR